MSQTAKDICLEDLGFRILTLDLAPGLLLNESALAERYGLSRTPLREVLQRLAGAGYITLEENRGAKVASMDIATLRTFFQTAPMVYANIARLAAEHRTTAQLDALGRAQKSFVSAVRSKDASAAALGNHGFHATIGEMAHNAYLVAALDRLLIDHARLSATFYAPQSREETALVATAAEQHDAMIAAIEERRAEDVVALTMDHWTLSRDRLERFVRPDPLPVDLLPGKDREDAV